MNINLTPSPFNLGDQTTESSGKCRVCFATNNVGGLVRNGVATANTSLARLLAAHGCDVTMLYTGDPVSDTALVEQAISDYSDWLIHLVFLAPRITNDLKYLNRSFDTFQWLLSEDSINPFDVIHFSECQGHGYYALQTKAAGRAFGGTVFAVTPHGSLRWCYEGNDQGIRTLDEISTDIMERRCVELADIVLAPSRHMLEWIASQGWKLPNKHIVRQYVLPIEEAGNEPPPSAPGEIVFFGRLEHRKGLHHFLDAIDLLKGRLPEGIPVTFLGEPGRIGNLPSGEYIQHQCSKWKRKWKILDSLGHREALDYVSERGRLSVIASVHDNLPNTILECLALKIPFLSSRAGGIPEMIHEADRSRCTYDGSKMPARNLADAILRTISSDTLAAPRFRVEPSATNAEWIEWHGALAGCAKRVPTAGQVRLPKKLPGQDTILDIFLRDTPNAPANKFTSSLPGVAGLKIGMVHVFRDEECDPSSKCGPIPTPSKSAPPQLDVATAIQDSAANGALFIESGTTLDPITLEYVRDWLAADNEGLLAFPMEKETNGTEIFLPMDSTLQAAGYGLGVGPVFVASRRTFPTIAETARNSPECRAIELWALLGNAQQINGTPLSVHPDRPIPTSCLDTVGALVQCLPHWPFCSIWTKQLSADMRFLFNFVEDVKILRDRILRLRGEIERKNSRIKRLNACLSNKKPNLLPRLLQSLKKHLHAVFRP